MRVDRSEQERVLQRFLAAVTTGDVQSLMDVLAPEVVLVADGGGLARAARHPLHGAKQVAAFLSAFPRVGEGATIDTLCLNGALAARVEQPAFGTTVVSVAVEHGRITHVYAMRNPTKLARLVAEAQLSR